MIMNLWDRSRAFRIFGNVIFGPVSFLIGMVCGNTLAKYTSTGNAFLIAFLMLFGLGAWWYAEDRERRSRVNVAQDEAAVEPQGRPNNESG
jgi:putative Mn2+ efflux pump MntP